MSHLVLHHIISAHALNRMHTNTGPPVRSTCLTSGVPSCHKGCACVQTRLSPQLVSEVEALLGEHEADLELSQQRSPKPGLQGPTFPAQPLLDVINKGIQVQQYANTCVWGRLPCKAWRSSVLHTERLDRVLHFMRTEMWGPLHVVVQHVTNRQCVVSYKVRCSVTCATCISSSTRRVVTLPGMADV